MAVMIFFRSIVDDGLWYAGLPWGLWGVLVFESLD